MPEEIIVSSRSFQASLLSLSAEAKCSSMLLRAGRLGLVAGRPTSNLPSGLSRGVPRLLAPPWSRCNTRKACCINRGQRCRFLSGSSPIKPAHGFRMFPFGRWVGLSPRLLDRGACILQALCSSSRRSTAQRRAFDALLLCLDLPREKRQCEMDYLDRTMTCGRFEPIPQSAPSVRSALLKHIELMW